MNIGSELLNVPFPELVKNLGIGIAEAQYALDKVSIRIAQLMSGFKEGANGDIEADESSMIILKSNGTNPVRYSLLELGFTPTFYQFTETYIELKMAMSMKSETNVAVSASLTAAAFSGFALVAASVNASYSQKFQYSAEGSSAMRTKLVTVPVPYIFEQRIKELVAEEKQNEINKLQ